jgi:chorismate-pyruvate lyase
MSAIAHQLSGHTQPDAAANRPALTAFDWLQAFADQAGIKPQIPQALMPAEMPAPFRQLLVHGNDMTSTLERFYQKRLSLEVLRRERQGPFYAREVVLKAGDLPVEYGVICIRLGAFTPTLQREIVAERLPLGRRLQDYAVPYISRPQEFFRLEAARYLEKHLQASGPHLWFGRRNLLLNGERRLLADVVEILSPVAAQHAGGQVPADYSGRIGQVLDEATVL